MKHSVMTAKERFMIAQAWMIMNNNRQERRVLAQDLMGLARVRSEIPIMEHILVKINKLQTNKLWGKVLLKIYLKNLNNSFQWAVSNSNNKEKKEENHMEEKHQAKIFK